MRIQDLFSLSLRALIVNKSRTALTMLGIVIGIASVILMLAVGQAAQRFLLYQVSSFGSDILFIANGKGDETRDGPPSGNIKQTITLKDFRKLKEQTWPKAVAGTVINRDLVEYGGLSKLTQVTGGSPDELMIYNEEISRGRGLSDEDLNSHTRVAVLGSKVADRLFGQEDPLGRILKIGKQPFKIIGILAPAGTRFFSDADDQVYIPFTTFFDLYNRDKLNFISMKTGTVSPHEAKELVRILLRETHNLDNPEGVLSKDDFRVATQEDTIKNAAVIGTILQILLGSVASISLIVAGVGIMNIMYVTVTERTREIGLRKAIGAKRRDILMQFLAEAIILTIVAGMIGIIVGISVSYIAILIIQRFQAGWSFDIPWNGVVMGFSVSALIGIIFGFFPAHRAASLSSIEALRYE
ncbi:ABC transporter permease [Candidatus Uhrbacteria bacterium]|nr:ABC transporter permease [Candidatus Uhrbacteria bacterium]